MYLKLNPKIEKAELKMRRMIELAALFFLSFLMTVASHFNQPQTVYINFSTFLVPIKFPKIKSCEERKRVKEANKSFEFW